MTRYWIVVAADNHASRGRAGGFVQANHGKPGPLRRMQPGDGVLIYSPTTVFGGGEKLQAFTGIGRVSQGEPYQADMGEGFTPWRRNVEWHKTARQAPIRPLLDRLEFTSGVANWGQKFRFGFFEIAAADFALIEADMIG